MRIFTALMLAFLVGCGPSYTATKDIDTIEAWEAYINEANPNDPHYYQAQVRLEELRFEEIKTTNTLEAFDGFLSIYDEKSNSQLRPKALELREDVMLAWADEQGTKDAFEKFISEYPNTKRKNKVEVRKRIHMAENMSAITVGPVKQERINMAEDPEGPLNGWGWWVDVTSNSEKEIKKLYLAIYYLDDDGQVIDRKNWPVVARYLPGFLPYPPGFEKPMKKGETRTWEWSDSEMPDGWSGKVRVAPVDIVFADEKDEDDE